MKVSSRTYEEEMRRRKESQPVEVIDCSELEESAIDKSVDELINKSTKLSIEEEKYQPKYVCIFNNL